MNFNKNSLITFALLLISFGQIHATQLFKSSKQSAAELAAFVDKSSLSKEILETIDLLANIQCVITEEDNVITLSLQHDALKFPGRYYENATFFKKTSIPTDHFNDWLISKEFFLCTIPLKNGTIEISIDPKGLITIVRSVIVDGRVQNLSREICRLPNEATEFKECFDYSFINWNLTLHEFSYEPAGCEISLHAHKRKESHIVPCIGLTPPRPNKRISFVFANKHSLQTN